MNQITEGMSFPVDSVPLIFWLILIYLEYAVLKVRERSEDIMHSTWIVLNNKEVNLDENCFVYKGSQDFPVKRNVF
jgi:hypothetical protein